jgi:RHS repeat-associated protein
MLKGFGKRVVYLRPALAKAQGRGIHLVGPVEIKSLGHPSRMRILKVFSRVAVNFILIVVVAELAQGQMLPQPTSADQLGEQPFGSYSASDIDSVGLTNGTLSLRIPLLSYPQRGKLHLDFDIVYNDQPQHWDAQCDSDGTNCINLWGWKGVNSPGLPVGSGEVAVGLREGARVIGQNLPDVQTPTRTIVYGSWLLITSDGAEHPLANLGTASLVNNGTNNIHEQYTGPWRTLDATGWFVNGTFTTNDSPDAMPTSPTAIIDADGVSYSPTQILDPNGNEISIGASAITDSLGRSIPFPPTSASPSNGNVSSCPVVNGISATAAVLWSVPGPNNNQNTYVFCYGPVSLNPKIGTLPTQDFISGGTVGSATKLQSIVLPDGLSWQFQYNDPDGTMSQGSPVNYGTLSQVKLPTGGTISYTYEYLGISGACLTGGGRWLATRTVTDGSGSHQWTYTYGPNIIVTDPLGNDTVHTFNQYGNCTARETQTQHYQGSHSTGVLLSTTNTIYSANLNSRNVAPFGAVNIVPTKTTTTWPNGRASAVTMSYDAGFSFTDIIGDSTDGGGNANIVILGKVAGSNAYDYGNCAPGALLRTSTTQYQALVNSNYLSNNLVNLLYSVKTTDPGGVQMAYTTYGYDETALVASSVTKQHAAGEPYPGNLTSVRRWLNSSTTGTTNCATVTGGFLITNNVFYDTGEVQKTTDPCGYPTTYQYGSTYFGAFPTTVTNALNQSTNFAYDFNTGSVTSIIDPNSQITTKTYDNMDRLTEVSYPDGGSTSYCYTDLGGSTCTQSGPPFAVVETQAINATAPVTNKTSTVVFDGLGRLSQTQLNSDPSGADYTLTTYDALGRKSVAYNPTRCSTVTSNCDNETTWGFTTTNYDALGRATSVVEQDGSTVSTNYSAFPCTTVTDEAGNSRQSCVDGLGRMTSVTEDPGSSPHLNYSTTYTYDALGNLTGVTQNGSNSSNARTRSFLYNSLSELTSATNPESGTLTYAYDADGNVITKTAPSPNQAPTGTAKVTSTYTYDQLNRLTKKSYTDGYTQNPATPAASYSYDGVAPTGCTPPTVTSPTNSGIPITPTNTIGRRSSMCDGSGATAWIYDSMGRPTIEERKLNGVTKNIGYIYYLDGEQKYQWYASDDRMAFDVSGAGRVLGVEDGTDNYVYDSATYTPGGQLASMAQYARSGSNSVGFGTTFFYNKRLQPMVSWADYTPGGTLTFLFQRCYDYHVGGGVSFTDGTLTCSFSGTSPGDNGNLYQVQNRLDDTRTQNFIYDSLNRINQAYTDGSNWGQQFTIDAWGNLTAVSAVSGKTPVGVFTATASTNNQLSCTAGCASSYDAAGNMLTDGNGAITYDAENRISTAGGVTYTYDGDGKRVEKSNGTLYWTGVGSEALSESDLSGNINKEYIFFDGMRAGRIDRPSNTVHSFLLDHLNSTRMMVVPASASTLTVEQDVDYTPYGIVATGTAADSHEFTGKERDTESGLDNFGARYDASSMGRFMTPDPLMASAKVWDPQTWNRYAYALNNPLKYVDPTGMKEVTAAQCAQDKNCVTIKVNVIYDKNSNDGKGLTDKQKADFEKGQLQSAKDQYGNADIHLDVTYTAGALSTENGKTMVSGLQAGALNVMVTDQVGTAGSEVVGKTAITFINPNSNDLPHEMAHQFMGDTQGWRNWLMNHDPIFSGTILNAVTDIGNDTERAWMRNIDQHSGPLSYYPLASAFHHNAAVFQRSIQPTTKPQQ